MNKQAYEKLMELNKKADLIDIIDAAKNKAADIGTKVQVAAQKGKGKVKGFLKNFEERKDIGAQVQAAQNKYEQQQNAAKQEVRNIRNRQAEADRRRQLAVAKSQAEEAAKTTSERTAELNAKRTANKAAFNKLVSQVSGSMKEDAAKKNFQDYLQASGQKHPFSKEVINKEIEKANLKGLTAPGRDAQNKKAVQAFLNQFGIGKGNLERMAQVVPGMESSSVASMAKGVPSFLTAERLAAGKGMTAPEYAALAGNLGKWQKYQDSGFWHRLMEWIKEKWAALSGGNPAATERGQAMAAGKDYAKALDVLKHWVK